MASHLCNAETKVSPHSKKPKNYLAFAPPKAIFLQRDLDGYLVDYPRDHPANDPEVWENIGAYIIAAPIEQLEEYAPSETETIEAYRDARHYSGGEWTVPQGEALTELRRLIGAYRTPWITMARARKLSEINDIGISKDTDAVDIDSFFIRKNREKALVNLILERIRQWKNRATKPDIFLIRLEADLLRLLEYQPLNELLFKYHHPLYLADQFVPAIRMGWIMGGATGAHVRFKYADNPGAKVLTWALKICIEGADNLDSETVARAMSRRDAAKRTSRTPKMRKPRFSRPGR